ncbi:hypothetical protein CCYA_CCYA03G0914 [Cyanidiococcus yangmingshanensis]|nr:hypothetical protein CCYA_CCYA03G0914 [Cyanidiococcus yangmingshanensis]
MGCFPSREEAVRQRPEEPRAADVTPLGRAVLANDAALVRKLLYGSRQTADVNEAVNASGATALILAIYENKSIDVIRELVRHPGVDLTRTTPQGFFALSFAAEYRDAEVVQLLIEAGADVNQQADASGWTALVRAMRHNRNRDEALAITRLLAKTTGIDIDRQDASGWTALHHSARYLPAEFTRVLVYDGHADVNHGKTDGWTPLMLTAGSNECEDVLETVKILATAPGIDLNRRTFEDEATALMLAASIRDAAMVRILVEAGASVNAVDRNGWAAIHHCLRYNELPDVSEILRVLLSAPEANVDLSDQEGWTPLMYAARYRSSAEIEVIAVEFRASVRTSTKQGSTALSMAVRYSADAARSVEILLTDPVCHPTNVHDALGWTPLITAVRYTSDVRVIELLARAKDAPLNAAEFRLGWTALMVAAKYRDAPVARILLEAPGCNPNIAREDGITALHIAVAREDRMRVGSFLDRSSTTTGQGATPALRNRKRVARERLADERTAAEELQRVARESLRVEERYAQQLELVRALLTTPTDEPILIDAQERRAGWTALHFAAAYDRADLVELLLESGASPWVQTLDGKTALDLAEANDFAATVRRLQQAMQKRSPSLDAASRNGTPPTLGDQITATASSTGISS